MAYGKHVKLQSELQAPPGFKWLTLFWAQELPKFHAPSRCWALKMEMTSILWHSNHTNFEVIMVEMCVFHFWVWNQKSLWTTSKLLPPKCLQTLKERGGPHLSLSAMSRLHFLFSALCQNTVDPVLGRQGSCQVVMCVHEWKMIHATHCNWCKENTGLVLGSQLVHETIMIERKHTWKSNPSSHQRFFLKPRLPNPWQWRCMCRVLCPRRQPTSKITAVKIQHSSVEDAGTSLLPILTP